MEEGAAEATANAISALSVGGSSEASTVSKNARKRELKIKQKEEERIRKAVEKAKQVAGKPNTKVADDDDLDPTQYFENRLKVL
ncbi:hypothetical protein, partial [Salmonella sp. s58078]|uniref:hypothetical protein n=1 Tax=Salmonella sp. s58078 TaxID=3159699 RepID=UPI00397EC8F3